MANEYSFKTFGPFFLDRSSLESKTSFKQLITSIEAEKGLANAIGVYLVAEKGRNQVLRPVYVGKTDAGFTRRLKQHKKGLLFTDPDEKQLPAFFLFLIARVSPKTHAFLKPKKDHKKHDSIDHAEDLLIGACLLLNSKLRNEKKKLFLSGFDIPGFTRTEIDELTQPARRLKAMLESTLDPVAA